MKALGVIPSAFFFKNKSIQAIMRIQVTHKGLLELSRRTQQMSHETNGIGPNNDDTQIMPPVTGEPLIKQRPADPPHVSGRKPQSRGLWALMAFVAAGVVGLGAVATINSNNGDHHSQPVSIVTNPTMKVTGTPTEGPSPENTPFPSASPSTKVKDTQSPSAQPTRSKAPVAASPSNPCRDWVTPKESPVEISPCIAVYQGNLVIAVHAKNSMSVQDQKVRLWIWLTDEDGQKYGLKVGNEVKPYHCDVTVQGKVNEYSKASPCGPFEMAPPHKGKFWVASDVTPTSQNTSRFNTVYTGTQNGPVTVR